MLSNRPIMPDYLLQFDDQPPTSGGLFLETDSEPAPKK